MFQGTTSSIDMSYLHRNLNIYIIWSYFTYKVCSCHMYLKVLSHACRSVTLNVLRDVLLHIYSTLRATTVYADSTANLMEWHICWSMKHFSPRHHVVIQSSHTITHLSLSYRYSYFRNRVSITPLITSLHNVRT